jgi:hypothetical protein
MIGRYVIARTFSAGVHYGILHVVSGKTAILRASRGGEPKCRGPRRLWRWEKHFTLTGVALHGPGDGARLSEAAPGEVYLSEVIELLDVTEEARRLLEDAP